jgi:hypothetical protein
MACTACFPELSYKASVSNLYRCLVREWVALRLVLARRRMNIISTSRPFHAHCTSLIYTHRSSKTEFSHKVVASLYKEVEA